MSIHPDDRSGIVQRGRHVRARGAGLWHRLPPHLMAVRPGVGGHKHRRRLCRLDERVQDRVLQVHKPRNDLVDPNPGLGQDQLGQAVAGDLEERNGRVHHVHEGDGRGSLRDPFTQRGVVVLDGADDRNRREQPLLLLEWVRGAAERNRRHVGLAVPEHEQADHHIADLHLDVPHDQRWDVVDEGERRQRVRGPNLRDVIDHDPCRRRVGQHGRRIWRLNDRRRERQHLGSALDGRWAHLDREDLAHPSRPEVGTPASRRSRPARPGTSD